MKFKNVIRFVIIVTVLIGLSFGGYKLYKELTRDKWEVEITNPFINVRTDHDVKSKQIGKVTEGSVYEVLEIYLEDEQYVWYKIKIKDDEGWISSSRTDPFVKEINSPNAKGEETYVIDYARPIVKYYEEEYIVENIDSINYKHLDITDDSEYTVESIVYYEEHPTDTDIPQYWIQYIVTDAFGNTTKTVQKIVFINEPPRNKVKDFSELKR